MIVEIFEVKSFTHSPETDSAILRLHRKFPGAAIRKINMADREKMQQHGDVVETLRLKGTRSLPIIKIDGKISSIKDMERLLS